MGSVWLHSTAHLNIWMCNWPELGGLVHSLPWMPDVLPALYELLCGITKDAIYYLQWKIVEERLTFLLSLKGKIVVVHICFCFISLIDLFLCACYFIRCLNSIDPSSSCRPNFIGGKPIFSVNEVWLGLTLFSAPRVTMCHETWVYHFFLLVTGTSLDLGMWNLGHLLKMWNEESPFSSEGLESQNP